MRTVLHGLAGTTALLALARTGAAQAAGSGTTTRYWDCCKPSCAWNDLAKLGLSSSAQSCDANDNVLPDTVQSACAGGTAYMCSDQTPWAVTDTLAYGFAAVSASNPSCCTCYQLTFTSGPVAGKQMIVQATNTGGDVAATQFDIAIPGGGFGAYDTGCVSQYGATSVLWGADYGGLVNDTCSNLPERLQAGCNFRFDWMGGADNPTVDWEEVSCPAAIIAKSGCSRAGAAVASSAPSIASASAQLYAATIAYQPPTPTPVSISTASSVVPSPSPPPPPNYAPPPASSASSSSASPPLPPPPSPTTMSTIYKAATPSSTEAPASEETDDGACEL